MNKNNNNNNNYNYNNNNNNNNNNNKYCLKIEKKNNTLYMYMLIAPFSIQQSINCQCFKESKCMQLLLAAHTGAIT